jgi:hypothetical protein
MSTKGVLLGYEVGTGDPVTIPLGHIVVCGQTQLSGKTTTLEALIHRSGLTAVSFVTKRGERAFDGAREIPPYFVQHSDWQYVEALLESALKEKLKFERSWIMKVTKSTQNLSQVRNRVKLALEKAKGINESILTTLDAYLDIVIPQIAMMPLSDKLVLQPGINVMDLQNYSLEMQGLVVASVLDWVYKHGNGVIVIIPEAWELVPQGRGGNIRRAAEQLARKGANLQNFVWVDSLDLAGVDKSIIRMCSIWILGVQREENEVKRTLEQVRIDGKKPRPEEIMSLERGQFFACWGRNTKKVYVQPIWADENEAKLTAQGQIEPIPRPMKAEQTDRIPISLLDPYYHAGDDPEKDTHVDFKSEYERVNAENRILRQEVHDLHVRLTRLEGAAKPEPVKEVFIPASVAEADVEARENDESIASLATRAKSLANPTTQELNNILVDLLDLLRKNTAGGTINLKTGVTSINVTPIEHRVELSTDTLLGRLAGLVAEGFFDNTTGGTSAMAELARRGTGSAKPNIYRELGKLVEMGVLSKEEGGFRKVPSIRVTKQALVAAA